jgi:IclR helix-turn-helix domain
VCIERRKHGFGDQSRGVTLRLSSTTKSLLIFNAFCHNTKQSIRQVAHQTGLSKSSVHRLKQAMERRDTHPESWWWETEAGRCWLIRLVVATLYTFGLKRGVGAETLSEFFGRLHLETQVGCSPSPLRGMMEALAVTIVETARTWEQDGVAAGEVREIIGAVDETFLEKMMLVFQDVPTGYIVQEEVSDDRTYATWKALVDERLKALGTSVLYLVSDRAKALIQLAEKGLECLSMPDFFHLVHEIVKSYSLAVGRRLSQAHKDLKQAEAVLVRHPGLALAQVAEAKAEVEARHVEVQRWEEVQRTYRHHLETLSLTLHPFGIADSAPQTSAQVASR